MESLKEVTLTMTKYISQLKDVCSVNAQYAKMLGASLRCHKKWKNELKEKAQPKRVLAQVVERSLIK